MCVSTAAQLELLNAHTIQLEQFLRYVSITSREHARPAVGRSGHVGHECLWKQHHDLCSSRVGNWYHELWLGEHGGFSGRGGTRGRSIANLCRAADGGFDRADRASCGGEFARTGCSGVAGKGRDCPGECEYRLNPGNSGRA